MIEKTPSLETEIANLEAQSSKLHGRIITIKYIPDKQILMEKRAKINKKLNDLKLKRDEQREAKAIEAINNLFRKNRNKIVIEVNGRRVQLAEDLTIPLTYSCGHKHPLHLRELLRFQRHIKLNSVLLAKWQSLLSTNVNLEARFSCDECRKEIAQKFHKTRIHSEKDIIGTTIVTLRKL